MLAAAREAGVDAVVDNTFATPVLQRPLSWGAGAVLHSATKYLGGHSDLLMGVVVAADHLRRDLLIGQRTVRGATPGVMESYLALRGLRTLPVRVARQNETRRGAGRGASMPIGASTGSCTPACREIPAMSARSRR